MPVTAGPIYPGIKKGLVFAIDPANKDSWVGPTSDKVSNLVSYNFTTGSIYNDTSGSYGDNESFAFDAVSDYIGGFPYNVYGQHTNFTLMFWCRFNEWKTSNYQQLFSEYIWVANYNDRIGVDVYNSSGTNYDRNGGFNDGTVMTVPSDLQEDSWFNVAICFNGDESSGTGQVQMYLTGSLSVDTSVSFSSGVANLGIPSGINRYEIGRRSQTGGNKELNGQIGPTLFYNRALSAGEVLQNYNRLKGRFGLS